MKVVESVRSVYEDCLPSYSELKAYVDDYFQAVKQPRWHYESRLKELTSFALKAETGRVQKISSLEDFFAATLVVENSASIDAAIALVERRFDVVRRRPSDPLETHKEPSSFVFDDCRLYLRLPEDSNRRPRGFEGLVFELQLKTFLQHAWAIATHDLTYKGDQSRWATSRIAFQVKAMLEHAELSIAESAVLADSGLLNKTNPKARKSAELIAFFRGVWPEDQLPPDLIRLANNVSDLLSLVGWSVQDLQDQARASSYIGDSPKVNISPYAAILLMVIENADNLRRQLRKKNRKIFLPQEAASLLSDERLQSLRERVIQAQ